MGDKREMAGFAGTARGAVTIMDRANIRKAVIMSPPRPFESYDYLELLEAHEQYPDRFVVFGGGGALNPVIQKHGHAREVPAEVARSFEAMADQMIAAGAKGFGEIAIDHASLNPGHGYESVPVDAPLLRLLADIAARHDVPIDVHFDPVPESVDTPGGPGSPKNPHRLGENVARLRATARAQPQDAHHRGPCRQ